VTNNARFLLLPDRTCPNLASQTLRLVLARLSADWQARYGHPVLVAAAHLADAPRGQKDLAAFAARLSQCQRRALGIRRRRDGAYPAPSQSTFCRLCAQVDALAVERAALAFQQQLRDPPPPADLIVLDGKAPRHTGGRRVLTAVTVPSQHYLGSALVAARPTKSPWPATSASVWTSTAAPSASTPCTPRPTPPAPWSSNTAPTTC
jgi:hypothetical protein